MDRRSCLLALLALLVLGACGDDKSRTQLGFTVDRSGMLALALGPAADAEAQFVQIFTEKFGIVSRGSSPEDKAVIARLAAEAATWLTTPGTVTALEGDGPVTWSGTGETEDMVFELTMNM
jgi:hypothetical protein